MTDRAYFIGALDGKNTSVVIDLPKMIGIRCSTIISKDLMQSLGIISLCLVHILSIIQKEKTRIYILIILCISANARHHTKGIHYGLSSPFSTTAKVVSVRCAKVFVPH